LEQQQNLQEICYENDLKEKYLESENNKRMNKMMESKAVQESIEVS